MKRFIIFDEYSNYTNITDEKGLKETLIEELRRDTFENGEEDFEIVKNNFKVMEKLALNNYDFEYLKEQLLSFGWYIQDLVQLQEDLSNFQTYKNKSGLNGCIEETLKLIESELKK